MGRVGSGWVGFEVYPNTARTVAQFSKMLRAGSGLVSVCIFLGWARSGWASDYGSELVRRFGAGLGLRRVGSGLAP